MKQQNNLLKTFRLKGYEFIERSGEQKKELEGKIKLTVSVHLEIDPSREEKKQWRGWHLQQTMYNNPEMFTANPTRRLPRTP